MTDWIGPCLVVLVLIAAVFVLYRLAFNHGYSVALAATPKAPRAPVKPSVAVNTPNITRCGECGYVGKDNHHPDCPKGKEQPKPLRRNWQGFSRIKRELESKEETA